MLLSEFIYGGMDGVITTVAIVAGIMGANIPTNYALVLGLANLCADGFSMGISRYNSLVDIAKSKNTPIISALATFVSFVIMGSIPLIPFAFVSLSNEEFMKKMLLMCSLIALLVIGVIKGLYSNKLMKSIIEVFFIGFVGIYVSFHVSKYVKSKIFR